MLAARSHVLLAGFFLLRSGGTCGQPCDLAEYHRTALAPPLQPPPTDGRAPDVGVVEASGSVTASHPTQYVGMDGDASTRYPGAWYEGRIEFGLAHAAPDFRYGLALTGGFGRDVLATPSAVNGAPIDPETPVTAWKAGVGFDLTSLSAGGRVGLGWANSVALASIPGASWSRSLCYPDPSFHLDARGSVPVLLVSSAFVPSVRLTGAGAPFEVELFGSLGLRNAVSNTGFSQGPGGNSDLTIDAEDVVLVGGGGLQLGWQRLVLRGIVFGAVGSEDRGETQTGILVSGGVRL